MMSRKSVWPRRRRLAPDVDRSPISPVRPS